jgi:hypothetical protein
VRVIVAILVTIAACGFSKQASESDGGVDTPVPDGGSCVAPSTECIASTDVLRTCGAAGAAYVDKVCGWGCMPGAPARCGELVPATGVVSRSVAAADATVLADLMLTNGMFINATDGNIGTTPTGTGVRATGEGTNAGITYTKIDTTAAIFHVRRLRIDGTVTLVATGQTGTTTRTRSIAIVVDDEIVINGILDVRGACERIAVDQGGAAGPGGFRGGAKTEARRPRTRPAVPQVAREPAARRTPTAAVAVVTAGSAESAVARARRPAVPCSTPRP